ncbi:MAG TPA: DUF1259 domain-containing protein [Gemmatimonadales bacterium]
MRAVIFVASLTIAFPLQAQNTAPWDSIARVLQTPSNRLPEYVRYNFPRRDLSVRIAGTLVPTGAVTSWLGFGGEPADAEVMGDLVTVRGETAAVLAECAKQGIDVLAVHNHLSGEIPAVTYVHVHAHGPAVALAQKLDQVLSRTAVPRPVEAGMPPPLTIDTALVFGTLGQSGRAQGAFASLTFMLVQEAVTMHGRTMIPSLAYASPIGIQMLSPERLIALGDLAIPAVKVQAVLQTLAGNGIGATAVHTHMINEEPRVYFIHFWADGAPNAILTGLRKAIDVAR